MVLDIRAQKLLIASPAGAARTRDARRSDELRRRDRGQRPVKFFKENNVRVQFLRPEEEARFAAEMQPEDWVVVEIALYTGLRRGEQFGLSWDHVDFGTGLLTVPRSKHGEARRVPLNDIGPSSAGWAFTGPLPPMSRGLRAHGTVSDDTLASGVSGEFPSSRKLTTNAVGWSPRSKDGSRPVCPPVSAIPSEANGPRAQV